MRILHLFDHSAPRRTSYALRSLDLLRAQARRGWRTLQMTTPRHGPGEDDPTAATPFHRTPAVGDPEGTLGGALCMRATARRLGGLAEGFEPDLIHAHSPATTAWPALWVGRRIGRPVVYEVRDLWEEETTERAGRPVGAVWRRLRRLLETEAVRRADAVCVLSLGLLDEMLARGAPSERLHLTPNAVDTQRFRPFEGRDPALAGALGLDPTADPVAEPLLGYIGWFTPCEGLELLVDAVARLRARGRGAKLLLVGDGPEAPRIRALAEARLGGAAILAGFAEQTEATRYASLIDLFVLPRRRTRRTDLVTPGKPLEAMAQGKLVAASDVGGHRELIRHGETGWLFPADDGEAMTATLEQVLDAPEAWAPVRMAARAFIDRTRSWDAVAERYRGVYAAASDAYAARTRTGAGSLSIRRRRA